MRKKVIILLSVVIGVMFVTLATLMALTLTVWKTEVSVEATQVEQTQEVKVKWATTKGADSVTIAVNHNGENIYETTLRSAKDLMKGEYTVPTFYGKQSVSITVNRGLFKQTLTEVVNVKADEYIIAPLVATMPVTLFSLELKSITNDYTVPTFVWLEREGAWDWSSLPQNVYPIPVASASTFTDGNYATLYAKTTAWIKELYEMDNDAFFHLYYNDLWSWGALQATYANKLPVENYKLTLLSDGSATFQQFNKNFDNDSTYEETYATMVEKWNNLKTEVANKGKYSDSVFESYSVKANDFGEYSYIWMMEENNVNWWLSNRAGIAKNAPTVKQMITDMANMASDNPAKKFYVKSMYAILNTYTAEEKAMLKQLYNMSDGMFSKSVEENKGAVVILGTTPSSETNFVEYVKATQAYYGENYVYYYKGHPGHIPSIDYARNEELGLVDLDATIPAELIFFFNEEAICSGYDSSTYQSISRDEQVGAIFNIRKSSYSGANANKDHVDFYVTKVDNSTESTDAYKALASNDSCFVLEFTVTTNYDIAIYDATASTLKYYKLNGSVYEEVNL